MGVFGAIRMLNVQAKERLIAVGTYLEAKEPQPEDLRLRAVLHVNRFAFRDHPALCIYEGSLP